MCTLDTPPACAASAKTTPPRHAPTTHKWWAAAQSGPGHVVWASCAIEGESPYENARWARCAASAGPTAGHEAFEVLGKFEQAVLQRLPRDLSLHRHRQGPMLHQPTAALLVRLTAISLRHIERRATARANAHSRQRDWASTRWPHRRNRERPDERRASGRKRGNWGERVGGSGSHREPVSCGWRPSSSASSRGRKPTCDFSCARRAQARRRSPAPWPSTVRSTRSPARCRVNGAAGRGTRDGRGGRPYTDKHGACVRSLIQLYTSCGAAPLPPRHHAPSTADVALAAMAAVPAVGPHARIPLSARSHGRRANGTRR